jgi:hypothetical protein
LLHAAIALLICVKVAPGLSVAQMVVRRGMPVGMPTWLQSARRLAAMSVCASTIVAVPKQKADIKSHGLRAIFVSL